MGISAGAATETGPATLSVTWALAGSPTPFEHVTENSYAPAFLGVPASVPSAASAMPSGNDEPSASDHVNIAGRPVARSDVDSDTLEALPAFQGANASSGFTHAGSSSDAICSVNVVSICAVAVAAAIAMSNLPAALGVPAIESVCASNCKPSGNPLTVTDSSSDMSLLNPSCATYSRFSAPAGSSSVSRANRSMTVSSYERAAFSPLEFMAETLTPNVPSCVGVPWMQWVSSS